MDYLLAFLVTLFVICFLAAFFAGAFSQAARVFSIRLCKGPIYSSRAALFGPYAWPRLAERIPPQRTLPRLQPKPPRRTIPP